MVWVFWLAYVSKRLALSTSLPYKVLRNGGDCTISGKLREFGFHPGRKEK
jgi:Fe2+ transport system protein FeoA